MFDLGWGEIAFWVVLAVVVIGPKDLPKFTRTIGQFVGKARRMTNNFTGVLHKIEQEVDIVDGKAEEKQRWADFLPDHVRAMKNTLQPHQDTDSTAEQYKQYREAVTRAKTEYQESLSRAET